MSTDSKTLDFARGCNSIQNQLVNFSYFPSFGTVRSEVRILSPRPINSSTYGYLQRWPYFICGQFVDVFFNQSDLTRESMGADISFGSLHIVKTQVPPRMDVGPRVSARTYW
jgi:hypothetical protein